MQLQDYRLVLTSIVFFCCLMQLKYDLDSYTSWLIGYIKLLSLSLLPLLYKCNTPNVIKFPISLLIISNIVQYGYGVQLYTTVDIDVCPYLFVKVSFFLINAILSGCLGGLFLKQIWSFSDEVYNTFYKETA